MSIKSSNFRSNVGHSNPTIVVTGACRSGKSLLGNVLATCKQAEYADEPYAAMLLPMVAGSGKIDRGLAKQWMSLMLSELFNDLILLRAANFRPDDISSVWSKKSPEEIFHRFASINSRTAAKEYAQNCDAKLIVTLSECSPFAGFLAEAIPNLTVLHVIRDAYAVAADTTKKKWFSNESLQFPSLAQLYNLHTNAEGHWYLPWFVDEPDHEAFLGYTEFERGVYYWWTMVSKGLDAFAKTQLSEITVHYEELVQHPHSIFDELSATLNLSPGPLTDKALRDIHQDNNLNFQQDINTSLKNRVSAILETIRG